MLTEKDQNRVNTPDGFCEFVKDNSAFLERSISFLKKSGHSSVVLQSESLGKFSLAEPTYQNVWGGKHSQQEAHQQEDNQQKANKFVLLDECDGNFTLINLDRKLNGEDGQTNVFQAVTFSNGVFRSIKPSVVKVENKRFKYDNGQLVDLLNNDNSMEKEAEINSKHVNPHPVGVVLLGGKKALVLDFNKGQKLINGLMDGKFNHEVVSELPKEERLKLALGLIKEVRDLHEKRKLFHGDISWDNFFVVLSEPDEKGIRHYISCSFFDHDKSEFLDEDVTFEEPKGKDLYNAYEVNSSILYRTNYKTEKITSKNETTNVMGMLASLLTNDELGNPFNPFKQRQENTKGINHQSERIEICIETPFDIPSNLVISDVLTSVENEALSRMTHYFFSRGFSDSVTERPSDKDIEQFIKTLIAINALRADQDSDKNNRLSLAQHIDSLADLTFGFSIAESNQGVFEAISVNSIDYANLEMVKLQERLLRPDILRNKNDYLVHAKLLEQFQAKMRNFRVKAPSSTKKDEQKAATISKTGINTYDIIQSKLNVLDGLREVVGVFDVAISKLKLEGGKNNRKKEEKITLMKESLIKEVAELCIIIDCCENATSPNQREALAINIKLKYNQLGQHYKDIQDFLEKEDQVVKTDILKPNMTSFMSRQKVNVDEKQLPTQKKNETMVRRFITFEPKYPLLVGVTNLINLVFAKLYGVSGKNIPLPITEQNTQTLVTCENRGLLSVERLSNKTDALFSVVNVINRLEPEEPAIPRISCP